jgi:MGT family glycosyltransferase
MLTGPEGPIPGISLRRPHNALTRFRARLLSKAAELVIQGLQGSASRLRQAHGLPATRMTFTEFSGTMPLYLVPSAPEFDYQRRDLPSSVHYVGPCLWDKPASQPPPPWTRELGRNGPRVLVTEGTLYTTDPTVLRVAAEGLANLPASVLLIAGKNRPISGLGPKSLPRNMTAPGWAPLSDLLPLADLVVCNGNSETVLAALSRGLPLIVVPSIWEQSETGWRVVESGAGLSMPAHRCTPARLRAAVERVLHEPSFRRNAERLAAVFARYGEANHAVRLLAGLVSERVTR